MYANVDFNAIKGLKLAHLNVDGLRKKFDGVKLFLQNYDFHVLSLNELRLPQNYKSSFLEIPNYYFILFLG